MNCNQVQETIARGETLGPHERAHAAACVVCGDRDGILEPTGRSPEAGPAESVPEGFADGVMATLANEPVTVAPLRWFERRWA